MAFTNEGKNAMLDHLKTLATHMRLLDDTDAEILDHDSASQDKALTWGAASNGVVAITNEPVFEIPGGTTLKAYSYRSSDGLTEYGRDIIPVESRETWTNDGTHTVTAASKTISDS